MRCLSDVALQPFVDGEGGPDAAGAAHLAGCARCRERLEELRRDEARIAAVLNTAGDLPSRLDARVREAIASRTRSAGTPPRRSLDVRGSTTLRAGNVPPPWRRPRIMLPLATAAVIALVVFGVLPRFGAPTTLSASQVLGRSLETLSNMKGVELLKYELSVSGIHHGTYYLDLAIDHEQPARFRAKTFLPDGTLVGAISQDPVTRRRSQLTRVDGRNYIVNVGAVTTPIVSLPQMAEALVETSITMMQATGDQKLTLVETGEGRRYVVEMPAMTSTSAATTFDLQRARVVVDARDYRILEFDAAGALLRQPFAVSFTLMGRVTAAGASPDPFELKPGPEDVVLEGIAADHPIDEFVTTIIRELARERAF